MVTRRVKVRRKSDQGKPCKLCVTFLLALAVIVGPHVWDRVISFAGVIANSSKVPQQLRLPRGGL